LEQAGLYQQATVLSTLTDIDLKQFNRRPSDLRLAEKSGTAPLEVLIPRISAGVE
jgi:hypothetical protein